MRIATWNCQTGLDTNWASVEALNMDAVTVQECGPDTPEQAAGRGGWSCEWEVGRYEKG